MGPPLRTTTQMVNPSTRSGQAARSRSRVQEPVAHGNGNGERHPSPYPLPQGGRGQRPGGHIGPPLRTSTANGTPTLSRKGRGNEGNIRLGRGRREEAHDCRPRGGHLRQRRDGDVRSENVRLGGRFPPSERCVSAAPPSYPAAFTPQTTAPTTIDTAHDATRQFTWIALPLRPADIRRRPVSRAARRVPSRSASRRPAMFHGDPPTQKHIPISIFHTGFQAGMSRITSARLRPGPLHRELAAGGAFSRPRTIHSRASFHMASVTPCPASGTGRNRRRSRSFA